MNQDPEVLAEIFAKLKQGYYVWLDTNRGKIEYSLPSELAARLQPTYKKGSTSTLKAGAYYDSYTNCL